MDSIFFSLLEYLTKIETKNIIMNPKHVYLLMIQKKTACQTTKGFMLVEVLVGILLTLILTAVAMQVVVMATAVKVRGDEITDATIWIQQDLEDVRKKANLIDYVTTPVPGYTYVASRCESPTSSTGYGAALRGETSLYGGLVGSTTPVTKTSSLGTRTYDLIRTATVQNTAPYNVLQVNYSVYRVSDTTHSSPILTSYAEVIPGASFHCNE
jgi:type II secretory pathway pseudopilin PulG